MTSTRILAHALLASTVFFGSGEVIAQTPLGTETASPDRPQGTGASVPDTGTAIPNGSGAAASGNIGNLGDIIVTARREEESIQTTPVAVTAMETESLRNAQIVDAQSIQRIVPSLSIQQGSPGTSGTTFVSIRGAGMVNPVVSSDPAVGFYVDGVYLPRPTQGNADLNDIARLEVLRGPQGTLFGRNTTGGAVNIITADPTPDLEGEIRGQIGNYDYRAIGAILNVPISEGLAARFVYDFSDRSGFGHNATLDRETSDRRSHFARGKIRWAPSDSDWSVTLSGDYNKITDHGQTVQLAAYSPLANPLIGLAGDLTPYLHTRDNWYADYGDPRFNNPYIDDPSAYVGPDHYSTRLLPYDTVEAYGGALTVKGKLGTIDITSISGYRYSSSKGIQDLDGTPAYILSTESVYTSEQYSQELQFSGRLSDRFNYILGGYYSSEKGDEGSLSQTFAFYAPAAPPPNYGYGAGIATIKNKSTGLFGQLYYSLTDKLRVTGGLRWTWDTREVTLHNLSNVALNTCSPELTSNPGFVPPCSLPRKANFDYPAWTFGVDYQASHDIFLYAVTRRAARAGGFNTRNGSAATPAFAPEKVKDVEAGLKMTSPDRRMRANVALFYSWQSGVHRNAGALVTVGGRQITTQYLQNAGNQRIYGAEFEVAVVPWKGMTLGANLSLLDGYYVRGSFTEVRDIPGANLPGCSPVPGNADSSRCIVDRSGEAVPQLPKTQFNLSAMQKLDTGIGELTLFANYSYTGSTVSDLQTAHPQESALVKSLIAEQNRLSRNSAYGLVDGRISLQLENPDIEIFAFGKNLTGKKYVPRRYVALYSSLGLALDYIGNPRVYGIGATFRFGPN